MIQKTIDQIPLPKTLGRVWIVQDLDWENFVIAVCSSRAGAENALERHFQANLINLLGENPDEWITEWAVSD